VEGKKYREFEKDCRAVSEIYGQLVMISIVFIAFSGIALTVFSEVSIENAQSIPHTDLQETINTSDNTIQIYHIGGEAIDLSSIKIVLNDNGQQTELNSSEFKVKNPDGSNSTDDALILGDCIVIDTIGKGVDLIGGNAMDVFVVHTPSKQIIQKTVLQSISWERPEWITPYPYGSICDKSGSKNETFLPTELVGCIGDGLVTDCHMEKDFESYEIFTFGIEEYELNIKDPLKNVSLDVVYSSHDNSQKDMILEINVGGNEWIKVADLKGPNKKDTNEKDSNKKDTNKKDTNEKDSNKKDTNEKVTYKETFPITDKVNTVAKIENLKVRFSAIGNSNSDNKDVWIDFVGIHVES
jgi:FlaG/FlaF family flagellin (archaellin)